MKFRKLDKSDIRALKQIAGKDKGLLEMITHRRMHHEPLAYIRGFVKFFGREFNVDQRTYIPNPETEHMVKLLLQDLDENSIVLDVGTGCGAIAITIALEKPKIGVLGSDINPNSIKVAMENAKKFNISTFFFVCRYVDSNISYFVGGMRLSSPYYPMDQPTHIISDMPYGDENYLLGSNNLDEFFHLPPYSHFHGGGILKAYEELIFSIQKRRKNDWKKPMKLFFETGRVEKEKVEKIIPKGLEWEYEKYDYYSVTIIHFPEVKS